MLLIRMILTLFDSVLMGMQKATATQLEAMAPTAEAHLVALETVWLILEPISKCQTGVSLLSDSSGPLTL